MACEPTLRLPPEVGRGGRAGWVALHAMRSLPDDVVLWAATSDGMDGVGGTAGACVGGSNKHRIDSDVIQEHIRMWNDATLHTMLGTSLPGAPTGVNMTDVYAVFRCGGG